MNDLTCEKCGQTIPDISWVDMGYANADGSYTPRLWCQGCYQKMVDEEIPHMGDDAA